MPMRQLPLHEIKRRLSDERLTPKSRDYYLRVLSGLCVDCRKVPVMHKRRCDVCLRAQLARVVRYQRWAPGLNEQAGEVGCE